MEYLAILALICAPKSIVDKTACEVRFNACIEELADRPAAKEMDLTKYDLAVHLIDAKNHKLCSK